MMLSNNQISEIAAQNKIGIDRHLSQVLYVACEWGTDNGYTVADCRNLMIRVAYLVGYTEKSGVSIEMRKEQKANCSINSLQIFNSAEFGQVRTMEEQGKIMFCGSDVARALGYAIPSKAVNTHCKGVSKMEVPTRGGKQEMLFIPEGDLYRLIVNSKLPSAEKFERWVFDEVLPSLRMSGTYSITPKKKYLAEAKLNNARARVSNQWLKLAEKANTPEYRQMCVSYASQALAGCEVMPLFTSAN